jgi:antitoxin component of MazEF toxin-antitoxin module
MQYIGRISRMGNNLYLRIPTEMKPQAQKMIKKDLKIVITEII